MHRPRPSSSSSPARFDLAPLALAVALSLGGFAVQAQTASAAPVNIAIAAQPLAQALTELARQAGLTLMVPPALVAGRSAPAVSGRLTPQQALDRLLAGSGLVAMQEGNAVVVKAVPAGGSSTLPVVTVTAASDPETASSPVKGYVAKRSATGTKTDTPIIETPQSISVITAERIEAMGATNLTDALMYTPGVKAFDGFDTRYDWLSIRGFDAYSPGFYLDGMQLRNNAGYSVWRTEAYGAERIEVLRGPSSVLFGQNSPGGMVNVVSKRPTEEPLRELQLQVGDHSRRQLAADFSGPLDAEGKLLYRLTAVGLDSNTQVDHVKNDRLYIAPAITWKPSGDTTLTVLSHYSRVRAGNSYGFLPPDATLLSNPNGRIPTSTFVGEPGFDRFNQNQWTLGYLLEHRLNDTWTLRQNARYGKIETDYRQVYQGGFISVDPANPGNPANFRDVNRYVFGSPESGKVLTVDNQAQARLRAGDWQHTLLVGLDYQRGDYKQLTYFGSAPSIDIYAPVYGQPVTVPDPYIDARTRLTQTGLYLQDQIKWNEHWVATLGGRYDTAKVRSHSELDGSSSNQTDNKFSGRAGLVYLAPSGWAPYVSYSESFSPTTTINPETNNPFKPETGKQYEAGLRYQPLGTRDTYSAAVFDLRRQNVITFGQNFTPMQTGEVRVRGLELEASFQPIQRMNVVAAYTWTPDADVTASSNPDQIGKQLVGTPRNQVSLWGDYRIGNGLKVGLGVRFVGSTHGANESAPAKIPSYTLFDAMLGYDFERWSLALNARNLTDRIYVGRNCDAYSCGYGQRRSLVATATYRW
ncbi:MULTISPECIES: TonB-dependent siderophore receptor [unclassified Variovorax]|uniref:TonB-dependent siderophore receptor n=1 Tax=unclassified Variovorax TaxID=663243 RepID=UPI0025789306|nr:MULTISPECIES: TonB-dependent siderophore receptor [unclassified Variovorax]MDM0087574.1 TonB-dependent siderophore receptor [Variovorax sp. J22G40]MDM0144169.1 TonB-dependent siderophore receptor [Variovorax sp. J2P1-31]